MAHVGESEVTKTGKERKEKEKKRKKERKKERKYQENFVDQ